jgi:hypothetical protein
MVIKSIGRSGQKGATRAVLQYLFKYVLKKEKVGIPFNKSDVFMVCHNIRNRSSLNQIIAEFEQNEKDRITKRSDQTQIHHCIISFNPLDSHLITDTMLRQMIRKYISLRCPDSLVVASKHLDTSHLHVHLAISGSTLGGRSSRVSKGTFNKITKELQLWHERAWPHITHSSPDHGRSKRIRSFEKSRLPYSDRQTSQKHQIAHILQSHFKQSWSIEEFKDQLHAANLNPYCRNNILTGICVNGRKFRLIKFGYDRQTMEMLNTRSQALQNVRSIRERSKGLLPEKENSRPLRDRQPSIFTAFEKGVGESPMPCISNDTFMSSGETLILPI